MKKKKITILGTGGTIEKTYDETDGSLENRETIIREGILRGFRRPHTDITIRSLMSKDSLDLTPQDREFICSAIAQYSTECEGMVVLHGTDTLDQTAKLCFEKLGAKLKIPVVFTGAMKPFGFVDSDAFQNFTEALLAAQILPAGLYLAFHSTIHPIPRIRKDKESRTFITLPDQN